MGSRNMTLTASRWGSHSSHSNPPPNLSSWHSSLAGWEVASTPPPPAYFPLPSGDPKDVSCRVSVILQIFKSNEEKNNNCAPLSQGKKKKMSCSEIPNANIHLPHPPALVITEKLRRFEMHFAHRLSINNTTLHFISLIFPMGSLSSLI